MQCPKCNARVLYDEDRNPVCPKCGWEEKAESKAALPEKDNNVSELKLPEIDLEKFILMDSDDNSDADNKTDNITIDNPNTDTNDNSSTDADDVIDTDIDIDIDTDTDDNHDIDKSIDKDDDTDDKDDNKPGKNSTRFVYNPKTKRLDPVNKATKGNFLDKLPDFLTRKNYLGLKITSIIIVAVIAVVFATSYIENKRHEQYINSDEYKLEQAIPMLVSGDTAGGLEMIRDVYTPQAVIIKEYYDQVEFAKDNFVTAVDSGDLTAARNQYEIFAESFENFKATSKSDIYYLPDEIKAKYECIENAFRYAENNFSADSPTRTELYDAVYDAQVVFYNMVERRRTSKDGSNFTLASLQDRIDISKDALTILEKYTFDSSETKIEVLDSFVISKCNTLSENGKNYIVLSYDLSSALYYIKSDCSSEIDSSESHIENTLNKHPDWSMNDPLYYTDGPDYDYKNYICSSLAEIGSYEDMSNNQAKIMNMMELDVFYYLITGTDTYWNN